ncbi:MAG: amidohydrolase family protein [Chloroflexi bacterium]|nr:amidohydrolase family protein [Chloroflexota bacterium]
MPSASILITGGTVITMDPQRSVIPDGAVAIENDRIVAVGTRTQVEADHTADQVIDAHRKVIMPGFIDAHGHAGHALVKTLGHGPANMWGETADYIYAQGTDEEFWYAEALLAALERLKFGTTCGLSNLGGGTMVMRADDPVYGDRHCQAIQEVGIREFMAVGPSNPPYPRKYARWDGDKRTDSMIGVEKNMETTETLIQRWDKQGDGRIHVSVMSPTINPARSPYKGMPLDELKAKAKAASDLARKYGVIHTQDGHDTGTVKFAHEQLGILGPDVLLSHSTGLTDEEIRICAETDTKIAHNPSSGNSYPSRCPVPKLLDAGVTVALGSDGAGPDMNYDMFRHMYMSMRQHRAENRDGTYMPPGKVLEMATIDAANAFGLGDEIGSLETGKKADVILVDMDKPHLYPMNMPVHRLVSFASGHDVDTVIVDGKLLMQNRVVTSVDEAEVLQRAQRATEAMLDRTGFHARLDIQEGFWGHSKYPSS